MHHSRQHSIVGWPQFKNLIAEKQGLLDLLRPNEGESFQSLRNIREWMAQGYAQSRTFISSLFGCFFRSLLHATIADLFDPVSRASGGTLNNPC
jgi:hypothetical protein